ncbi:FAD-binding oxidoreductase, partial [Micromonospora azadirachtae]
MTTTDISTLAATLRAVLGDAQVISDRQELRTYECDGLAQYRVIPALVALPRTAAECAATV